MNAVRSAAAIVVAAVLPALVTGCSDHEVEPLGLTEIEPGVLELTTSCGQGLSAEVEEADDEVHIDRLQGDAWDGVDCAGILTIELDEPLRARAVVVDGERWIDLPTTCWASIGPPRLGDRPGPCATG